MKLSIRKILIAGGAGFIGSQTVNKLASLGYKVVVIDNLSTGRKENISSKAKFYHADIRNADLMDKIFKKEESDVVMNLAAKVYWHERNKDSSLDISTNALGTINLLESCLKHGVKKIIFSSSISLYTHSQNKKPKKEDAEISLDDLPVSVFSYAASKFAAEQYIKYFHKKFKLDYTILRYAHVYGPRHGVATDVISIFLKNITTGRPLIVMGSGNQFTDYVYIDDVVAANVSAITRGNNQIINVGNGRPVTVNNIISCLKKNAHNKIKIKRVDQRSVSGGGACADISLAKKELKWKPRVSLEKGLAKIIKELNI